MEPAVIGYFDASNEEDMKAFEEIASKEGANYRFAFTTDKETLESKKYDNCAVVVYPPVSSISTPMTQLPSIPFPFQSRNSLTRNSNVPNIVSRESPLPVLNPSSNLFASSPCP
jgi:hypothetical protein